MLFGFGLIVVLLSETVSANGCSETYKTSPGSITASSEGNNITGLSCTYYVEGNLGHYAILNFTSFHGFPLPQLPPGEEEKETTDTCRPLVQIMEIVGQGSERFLGNVCYDTPKVFQSNSHIVKMAFRWSPSQSSGFSLAYSFKEQGSACEFECRGDGTCLPDINLVCNGVSDCQQGFDEKNCLRPKNPSLSSPSWVDEERRTSFLQVVIVVTFLVLALVILVACVVIYHRVGHRFGRPTDSDRHHLRSQSPSHTHNSEVVYVPGLPTGNSEPAPDMHRFNPAAHFPPQIPISDDGEGGYISQSALRSVHDDELHRPFMPAPNRTASEGESPPPYRSRSVGYLDHDPGWSHSRRAYSMSSNNNNKNISSKITNKIANNNNNSKGGSKSVTAASSTSPLLGSSRSTCTSSPSPSVPPFYHHTHPPASLCRSPHARTHVRPDLQSDVRTPPPHDVVQQQQQQQRTQQTSMVGVPRAVCPIHHDNTPRHQLPDQSLPQQQQQPPHGQQHGCLLSLGRCCCCGKSCSSEGCTSCSLRGSVRDCVVPSGRSANSCSSRDCCSFRDYQQRHNVAPPTQCTHPSMLSSSSYMSPGSELPPSPGQPPTLSQMGIPQMGIPQMGGQVAHMGGPSPQDFSCLDDDQDSFGPPPDYMQVVAAAQSPVMAHTAQTQAARTQGAARTAPNRTAPNRTAPNRTAPARTHDDL